MQTFVPLATASRLRRSVLEHVEEGQTALVLIAEDGAPSLDEVVQALRCTNREFLGGVFPGVLYGAEHHSQGAVVLGLNSIGSPVVFSGLGGWGDREVDPSQVPASSLANSAVVLLDGLASSINPWLRALFDRVGQSISFLGAGAGSMNLEPSQCLFSGEGVFQDAAIVAFQECRVGIGVRHGWQPASGALVVDGAQGNSIESLNWQNPLEVYAALIEEDSGVKLDPEDFFATSKGFPFGLQRSGHEVIVRDPIRVTPEGYLVCIGEVPENSVVTLLKGEADSLIAAAGEAACAAFDNHSGAGAPVSVFAVECVSRNIFLEARFGDELRALQDQLDARGLDHELAGVLSLGEVASTSAGPLELLNKTSVIGCF